MPGHGVTKSKRPTQEAPINVTADAGDRTRNIVEAVRRRAYAIFENGGRQNGREFEDWLQAEAELLCPVQLACEEVGNTLVVRGELPGFSAAEIEVQAEPQGVTIAAERDEMRGAEPGLPSQTGLQVLGTIALPTRVLNEKAVAYLSGGKLVIVLPKSPKGREPAK